MRGVARLTSEIGTLIGAAYDEIYSFDNPVYDHGRLEDIIATFKPRDAIWWAVSNYCLWRD